MSKSVLISIKPKWCELIAMGKKTVEVRKTRPKLETPFKCYIYCTKPSIKHRTICGCMVLNDDELYRHPKQGIKYGDSIELMCCDDYDENNFLNGKIIGEFVCDEIIKFFNVSADKWEYLAGNVHENLKRIVTQEALLTEEQMLNYGGKYGWKISQFQLYDEPKKLSDFGLKRPPQSWCSNNTNNFSIKANKG